MRLAPASPIAVVALIVGALPEIAAAATPFEGRSRLDNGTLVLRARNDFGECRLTLKRDGRALVVSEDDCLPFHGSACEFAGTYQPVPDAPR